LKRYIAILCLVGILFITACETNSPDTGSILVLLAPSGEIYDSTPVYRWEELPGATQYQIEVWDEETRIFNKALDSDKACEAGVCRFSPTATMNLSTHRWRVRAYMKEEWQAYSEYATYSYAADKLVLEQHAYNLEDCIYSWWTYPIATHYDHLRNKTYIGYTDSEGFSGVASIDNDSGQIVKTRLYKNSSADDHNGVAVDVLPDGRIIAAYSGGHIKTSRMYVRISTKPENIEEFEEPVVIEAGKATTYAQLLQKSGKLWLFFRTGRQEESSWSYSVSTDGQDWSEPVEIVSGGMQYYLKVMDTTDSNLFRLVMYSNPNAGDTNIRLGFFDTETGELKRSDGTVLGTTEINKDLFPVIIANENGKSCRLLDVALTESARTVVAFAVFSDASDAEYRVGYYTDKLVSVPVALAGDAFYTKSVYVGGMAFGEDADEVYLSREEAGRWLIEAYRGEGQEVFRRTKSIFRSELGLVAIRPIVELHGDKLIWQEGSYNPESYSDFQTDLQYFDLVN
jgi:hypothetical protein